MQQISSLELIDELAQILRPTWPAVTERITGPVAFAEAAADDGDGDGEDKADKAAGSDDAATKLADAVRRAEEAEARAKELSDAEEARRKAEQTENERLAEEKAEAEARAAEAQARAERVEKESAVTAVAFEKGVHPDLAKALLVGIENPPLKKADSEAIATALDELVERFPGLKAEVAPETTSIGRGGNGSDGEEEGANAGRKVSKATEFFNRQRAR